MPPTNLLHANWLRISTSHSSLLTDDFSMNRFEKGGTREKMSGSLIKE